jgi:tetratricopeptide (TPR) repeat protein
VGEDPWGRAVAASEHALELDDSLALAVAVIGNIGQITGRLSYEEALEFDRRAMEADPHNATVRLWTALHWVDLGFFDQAVELLQSCLEIDPAYTNCKRHLANAYLSMGNEQRAIELFQQGSEEGFNGNDAAFVPAVLRNQGRAAASYVAGTLTSQPGFPVGDLLDILQFPERDHTAARQRFRARLPEFKWSNQSNKPLVGVYFGFYDLGAQDIEDGLYWIWGPDMAEFRRSPQFKQLVMNVGLLDYWRGYGFPPQCRPLGEEDFDCE